MSYVNERDPHGHNRQFNWGLNRYEPSVADERADEEEGRGDTYFPPEPNPNHLHDPGFREGAILTQAQQWPDRVAALTDPSTQEAWHPHVKKDSETGLGYDALVRRNPKGDGWDVVRPLER